MIALWMAYTVSAGALLALACELAERLARSAGRPTRALWATGMGFMLLIGAIASRPEILRHHAIVTPTSHTSQAPTPLFGKRVGPSDGFGWKTLSVGLPARIALVRRAVDERLSDAAARLTPFDRPLLGLWLLATILLAGLAIRAALDARCVRHVVDQREIAGAPVLVTEHLGPSAVGARKGAILLPRWALELDDGLLDLIVRHEREHLMARDPLLLLATLLAVVLLPWDFPLWWCWRRLRLAIEMDCDARVLRAHPDIRRYAQLLLLTTQRTLSTPRWRRPLLAVVAPLQPHASHLARRILAMTDPRTIGLPRRIAIFAAAVFVVANAAFVLPMPRPAAAQRAPATERVLVHITSVGLEMLEPSPSILIYTSSGGRVGLGLASPQTLTDTLRLDHLPAMTLDVTDGDVQLRIVGPGRLRVGGTVTGGPSTELSGEGRHITLLRGGRGIHTE